MAINISQAFHRTSANPVDETMALTKAQMLTVNDNLMPAYYLTICQDDGAIYLYDKSAAASVETGKFSIFEGGKQIQVEEIPTAATEYVGVILQYIGETDTNYINGYFYKCVEDSSTTPSTYSWKNVEVQNGTISMELTQSDYDNLTEEQKTDGTVYYITDAEVFTTANAPCGFTPIGTIISVMGNSAPRNYLACNGQIVNIVDYPELAQYFEEQFGSKNKFGGDGTTTFGIPDLRGEFLRGTGTNSHTNQGNGGNVGVHQDATNIPNLVVASNGVIYSVGTSYLESINTDGGIKGFSKTYRYNGTSSTSATLPTDYRIDYNIRPTNTSVLYCIAVRNIYVDARLDYSTDEKVVGTWIDGRTLYQKTVVIDDLSQINTTTRNWYEVYRSDNTNYSEVFINYNSTYLSVVDSGQLWSISVNEYLNVGTPDAYISLRSWIGTDGKINVSVLNSGNTPIYSNNYSNKKLYVTLQYTKTTD